MRVKDARRNGFRPDRGDVATQVGLLNLNLL